MGHKHTKPKVPKRPSDSPPEISPLDIDGFNELAIRETYADDLPDYATVKGQNRFKDILPNNLTRVVVSPTSDGEESSTYINANWIHGAGFNGKGQHAYIASQGPLSTTLDRFVRMIFENDVQMIVMLTRLTEGGKKKCEAYWNDADPSQPKPFGDITVVVSDTQDSEKGYIVQTLKLTSDGRTKTVYHFYYQIWPDHSVPQDREGRVDPSSILDMTMNVRQLQKTLNCMDKPLLVHCSAGVGRTGTYIALDHAMDLIDHGKAVDVCDIIDSIRKDRMCMVQHLAQYKFVHEAVLKYAALHGPVMAHSRHLRHSSTLSSSDRWVSVRKHGDNEVFELDASRPAPKLDDADSVAMARVVEEDGDQQPTRLKRKPSKSVEEHQYYRPELNRKQVEELLSIAPRGAFVVRDSSKANHFALSVALAGKVTHILITPTQDSPPKYIIASHADVPFSSIDKLVEYYKGHTLMRDQDGSVKLGSRRVSLDFTE